jgi:hypothetical protein
MGRACAGKGHGGPLKGLSGLMPGMQRGVSDDPLATAEELPDGTRPPFVGATEETGSEVGGGDEVSGPAPGDADAFGLPTSPNRDVPPATGWQRSS